MKITLTVADVSVDVHGITSRVDNDRAFWLYAATTWHKLYSPYVPFDEGALRGTVVPRPKEIEHTMPYARYQYYGVSKAGKPLKYRNSKASAKWDQAAAPTQLPRLASSLQQYIDSGRLKLD